MKTVLYDNAHIPTLMVGRSVVIFPINHTSELVSNGGVPALTSPITVLHGNGIFETENSMYVPCDVYKEKVA